MHVHARILLIPLTLLALGRPPETGRAAQEKSGPDARPNPVTERALSSDEDGEPLPAGAIARLGTTRMRHAIATAQVAASPDGKILASTGHGPGLRLVEIATGKLVHEFPLLQQGHVAMSFSPDSKLLAVNNFWDKSYQGTCLLDVASGKVLRRLETDGKLGVIQPAFSPDGKLVGGALDDDTIGIWNVGTGKEICRLRGLDRRTDALAFSPDGKMLASAGEDKVIHLWDPSTGTELGRLIGHRGGVANLCFSKDGTRLASLGDNWSDQKLEGIRFWDIAGRRQVGVVGAGEQPTCMARSGDGTLLAAGNYNGSITLWDFASGRKLGHFPAHAHPVTCLTFTSVKIIASTAIMESAVRLWDIATGREIPTPAGHAGAVEFLRFSDRGTALLSVGRDQTMRTWDWSSGRQREVSPCPGMVALTLLAVSGDGTTLAARGWNTQGFSYTTSHDGRSWQSWRGASMFVALPFRARRSGGLGRQ